MERLFAALGEPPYHHSVLATNPSFTTGTPASSLIPEKEPTGSRRVPVKRLPAWTLEPDLQTFGPFIKAAGVVYSPSDLSTFARAIPDVSTFICHSYSNLIHSFVF